MQKIREVIFFDTSNTPNPYEQNDGYSAKNNTEAEVVVEYILPKLFENNLSPKEIAIIAPYKSQVANIKRYINNSTTCIHKNIDVSTLDSFQGKEYDIILFSFTRSSNFSKPEYRDGKKVSTKVGFLDDARRLNVAFSRAKKKLILVGNSVTLTDPRSHFDLLFDYTTLFRNLVRLSRNENIGNFLNIADYYKVNSTIENDINLKKGDIISVSFKYVGIKEGKTFGIFFVYNNLTCLLPDDLLSNENRDYYYNLKKGDIVRLTVNSHNKNNQRIYLKPLEVSKDEIWSKNVNTFKIGTKLRAKVKRKVDYGYFLTINCGYEGLLYTKNKNIHLEIGQEITVTLTKVDIKNKQIGFSIS